PADAGAVVAVSRDEGGDDDLGAVGRDPSRRFAEPWRGHALVQPLRARGGGRVAALDGGWPVGDGAGVALVLGGAAAGGRCVVGGDDVRLSLRPDRRALVARGPRCRADGGCAAE